MKADLPLRPERLSSRTIFEGEKLTLRVDRLQLGDREPADKEIIQHPGSAVMLPITEVGTVLLVKQWRHAAQAYTLELPSGTREGDEKPILTAARELREETGYRADDLIFIGELLPLSGYSEERAYAFLALDLHFDPLPQDRLEDICVAELRLDEFIEQCSDGTIEDALTIAVATRASSLLESLPEVERRGTAHQHD